ncbi:MAG: JAB domain-containing protein [Bacteroidota bacterium]
MKQITQRVAELRVSYQPTKSKKTVIQTSLDAYNVLREFFPTDTIALQERFVTMYLNRSNTVLGIYVASNGGISGTVADPRLILATALKVVATSIILAHNHPSGNMKPSKADEQLTRKIKEASLFMDIQLTDHIILSPTKGEYYSLADEGLM